MRWSDIMHQWLNVSLDLHETFGVDTESDILDHRTWWWLRDRIVALVDQPSRLRRALNIPDTASIG